MLLALFSTLFRAAADMIGARWAFVKGWMHIDNANVYFDHPYHAPFDHALAIDFNCETDGGTERVAVELSASSARALVEAILAALASGEAEHAS